MPVNYKQLSPKVSRLLFNERSGVPEHVSVCSIYEQQGLKGEVVRFKQILARVENRLGRFPQLRQRINAVPLDLDYPYLVDDADFDVEFHVRHLALPAPGDRRQLCIQVSRLHTRKLDRDRPLWEMYVIEGLNNLEGGIPSRSFAIMLKVHLGLLDGVPAHEILGVLHDEKDDTQPASETRVPDGGAPAIHEMVLRGFCNSVIGAFGLAQFSAIETARLGWDRLEGVARSSLRGKERLGEKIPRTRFDAKLSRYRVFDGVMLPMAAVLKISEKFEVSLGDVSVSLCAGALHEYLSRKGELPRNSLRAYVSWAHSASAFEDELAGQVEFPELIADIGSQFSDPIERLNFLRDHLKRQSAQQTDTKPKSNQTIAYLSENLPAVFQSVMARMGPLHEEEPESLDIHRHCSIRFIEDVNRSDTLLGASRLAVTYLAPLAHGCGLGFIVSHDDKHLMITFTADREQIRDPGVMRQDLLQSYQTHLDASRRRVDKRAAVSQASR